MYPRRYAHYTLLERLAVGGMSEVDLACRTVDDSGYVRFLAVKRIRAEKNADESFIRMFQDEARITSALRHTHIAQVYDFGKVGDEYYLALEFVPGLNLRDMINHESALNRLIPPKITLRIMIDVLDALDYAHARSDDFGQPMNIVHRDANPRNIMVSTSGETKLIDFGVARASDRLERTRTNHFKGKVAYMAPEQVQGQDIDQRADIFAMGLTLFELITGHGTFRGLDQMQIMYRLVQGRLPKLDVSAPYQGIADSLKGIFAKATAHSVEDRYLTAKEMSEALSNVATGQFTPATSNEVLAYLNTLDPQLNQRMQDKIRSYSDTGSFPKSKQPLPPPMEDTSATLDQAGVRPVTGTSTAPLLLVGALGTATVTLAVVGVGLLAIIVALVIWQSSNTRLTEPPDEASQIEVTVPELKNTEEPPPVEEPVVPPQVKQERPIAKPKTTFRGKPKPTAPTTAEVPKKATVIAKPTEPLPTPPKASTIPPAQTTPVPDKAPKPTAATTGTLQITSNPKGRAIMLNGKTTNFKTPARIEWPTGTIEVRIDGFSDIQNIQLGENERRIVSFR